MAPANRHQPQRAASSESEYTLDEFRRDFPDDAACLNWLWRTRYSEDGEHAECPKCERVRAFKKYATTQGRQSWTCTGCGLHIHPTAGTIFHKSSTSLALWFYAIYLMTSTRCGISAKQLEREIGCTYKTAWRMFHLIRNELMTQDDAPLSGDVEMDETYVGGRPRLADKVRNADGSVRKGRSTKKKATVFGAVERGGRVRAEVIPDGEKGGIPSRAASFALPESTIFTDEYVGYNEPGKGYVAHHRIRHQAGVYVSGDVHTQSIEGFWSLVKNGLRGSHHAVSAKHLQGYLNEYAWRYNHRGEDRAMFLSLILRAASV